MKLTYLGIDVEDGWVPTEFDLMEINANTNCQRSFMGKDITEVFTPTTQFYKITEYGITLGGFFLDAHDNKSGAVCVHILMLDSSKRDEAVIATKLAAMLSRLRGMIPYTTVSPDPKYDYMRKFLHDCGFVHHMIKENIEIITIPTNYVPDLTYLIIKP